MSINSVTPKHASVKPSMTEAAPSEHPDANTSVSNPHEPNGEVRPVLDEFGLPIRSRRERNGVEDDENSDELADRLDGVDDKRELENGSDLAPVKANVPSERIKLSLNGEGPDEEGLKTVNGHNGHTEAEKDEQHATAHEQSDDKGKQHHRQRETRDRSSTIATTSSGLNGVFADNAGGVSEWSHQRLAPKTEEEKVEAEDEWQTMPAFAPFDMYNDDNKLIAREQVESDDEEAVYGGLGGAGKGYTRVQLDDDVQSATSMDDNTAYLFKEQGTGVVDEYEEERDILSQMQATKDLLTEGQRIAYVGITRLAMIKLEEEMALLDRTRGAKKMINHSMESLKMWAQKMMVRLYSHMDIDPAEQIMIEQLAEHGVQPKDLSPALMKNARVKNPILEETASEQVSGSPRTSLSSSTRPSISSPPPERDKTLPQNLPTTPDPTGSDSPPPYDINAQDPLEEVHDISELPQTQSIDIDIRWTILCDLFLVLIADSVYDARSRQLFERVGSFLEVPWIDICRFEKRVTDALEVQEAANKENWNEDEHMESRRKLRRNRRLALMGLATVGGGIVIGLSAGLLAPFIGAGLAAGFTTIGVAGTSGFLTGAGGAAIVATTGIVTGGTIGVRAANKRTGDVRTFEYRPLHNNKRTNLIVTVSGWMSGKVDDVRLPFSTVDPIMGDIYSVHWEPEMLRSMGDTINILANEALTQTLQQVLGATILATLMSALQAPIILTKLSYLIDNPWSNSLARAHLAGLIFADSLIDRNLGTRPITLVGFSLGAKVIFSCLQELANKGAYGLIQNVYLFGSPMIAKKEDYQKAKTVVAGRFVNGYATNDWILGYLFRATGGGLSRVAGLAAVECSGIENINVSETVPGHMQYRSAMPKLLREVGWSVESDEFTEIEDPDPDNHERRQRELIDEIEEARKELEKPPEKRRFKDFFKTKGKSSKKEWETYDERTKAALGNKDNVPKEGDGAGILFDVEAIRAEVAELAAEGLQVKELESTLPPMRLDMSSPSPRPVSPAPKPAKSFNDAIEPSPKHPGESEGLSKYQTYPDTPSYSSWGDHAKSTGGLRSDGSIQMSFDTSCAGQPEQRSFDLPRPPPKEELWPPNPAEPSWRSTPNSLRPSIEPPRRPSLEQSKMPPAPPANATKNAWADDDDEFGGEKEMQMTFE